MPGEEKRPGIQTEKKSPVGISTLFKPRDPLGALRGILDSGLDPDWVEVALADRIPFDQAPRIGKLGEKKGIKFSVHSPFLYDDLAHPHEEVRKIYLNEAKKAIDFTDHLGGEMVVIHPGGKAIQLPKIKAFGNLPYSADFYLKKARGSIEELRSYAEKKEVKLAAENTADGVGSSPEEIEFLLSDLREVKFNLDVGHANLTDNISEFTKLSPKNIHLHDNEGEEDLHLPPGKGNIDFSRLGEILKKQDFRGKLILELYGLEKIKQGMDYLKTQHSFYVGPKRDEEEKCF